jgi:hypothetical protein
MDLELHVMLIMGEIDQETAVARVYENLNSLYNLKGEHAYP